MKRKYTKKSKPKYKKHKPNVIPQDVYLLLTKILRDSLLDTDDGDDSENDKLRQALAKLRAGDAFSNSFTVNRDKVKTENMPEEVMADHMKNKGSLSTASDATLMALNQQYQIVQRSEDLASAYMRFVRASAPSRILLTTFIVSQKPEQLKAFAEDRDFFISEFTKSFNRIYPKVHVIDVGTMMSRINEYGLNVHEVVTKYGMSLIGKAPNDMQRSMIVMNMMNGVIHHKLPVITLEPFVGELQKGYDNPNIHGYYVDFLKEYNPDSLKSQLFDPMAVQAPELAKQISGFTDSVVHEVQKVRYEEGDPGMAMPYDYSNVVQVYKQLIRGSGMVSNEVFALNKFQDRIPPHALESALVDGLNSIDSGAKTHNIRSIVHSEQAMRIFTNAASIFRGNDEYERILHKVFHIKHVEPIHYYDSDPHKRGYRYHFGKKFLEGKYAEVFLDKDIKIDLDVSKHKPEYQFDPQAATMTPIPKQTAYEYLSGYFAGEEE